MNMGPLVIADIDGGNPVTIERVHDRAWVDEGYGPGGGRVRIKATDPELSSGFGALQYDRLVYMDLFGDTRFAWFIETREFDHIVDSEKAGEVWQIAGRGVLALVDYCVVHPERPLYRKTPDDRLFTPAADKYNEAADGRWHAPFEIRRQDNLGGPWWGFPTDWPEEADQAFWIWPVDGTTHAPGWAHFRKTFTVSSPTDVAIFLTGDNSHEFYLDGELLSYDTEAYGWRRVFRADVILDKGNHTIYVRCENYQATGGDNPGGLLFAILPHELSDGEDAFGAPILISDSSWSSLGYPDPTPGFTQGEIIRIVWEEAVARDAWGAKYITLDFDDELDSNGDPWDGYVDLQVRVGVSYLHLFEVVAETGVELYMTPALELRVYKKGNRGTDKSSTVEFLEGHLLALKHNGRNALVNVLLVRDNDGWTRAVQAASATQWGRKEGFLTLGDSTSQENTNRVKDEAFAQHSQPSTQHNTKLRHVEGARPYIDFDVGDLVGCPNEAETINPRRVLSISVAEDENDQIYYEPEIDR